MSDVMIETENLSRSFGRNQALRDVELAVPSGTVLGLLGPNGAGKTTLVRILATLLHADSGRARVAGYDVTRDPVRVRAAIGLTGQYAALDANLTGAENLRLIGRLLNLPRSAARSRAAELLTAFGLTDAANRRAATYSGGMRRRLDLAASLVGHPQVLFLDEPTTGLDPRSRSDLWVLVRRLVTEGTTVLLTTQYLDEAEALADAIVVVDQGRIVAAGTATQLKARTHGTVLRVQPAERTDVMRLVDATADLGARATDPGDALILPVDDDADGGAGGNRARSRAGDLAELTAAVMIRVGQLGVPLADLGVRRPSLDDVFLALTGRSSGPTDANRPDARDDAA